jgi:hypothetical protein
MFKRIARIGLILGAAILASFVFYPHSLGQGSYQLPNNDAGCPANCRQIPWKAGSDLWNGGTLPNYTSVQCTGLTEGDGTTDNTARIQSCLNALSQQQATLIPPGIYFVNGTITMPSNVVLRGSGSNNCGQGTWLSSTFHGDTGAGAKCTTLKYGTNGWIKMAGDVGNNVTRGSEITLSSGYTKGSTSITASGAPGVNPGDFIAIYEQPDSSIPVTNVGAYGTCTWCGEANLANNLMIQIDKVTAVNGNTMTLDRPLYYTFLASSTPKFRSYTFSVSKSGVEDIKLYGNNASRSEPGIGLSRSVYCWVKNVEFFGDPDVAKAFPVFGQYVYADEIRDSYFHFSLETQSDRAYSVGFMFSTSDNKVENNIFREQRHGGGQEGGGSGNVWLYNYIDDLYFTYDLTWMDSMRMNHGAHPYFILIEGNIASQFGSDVSWGSSSHMVLFRNWFWGDTTGNYSGYNSTNPNQNFNAVRVDWHNNYFAVVGNVLGNTAAAGGPGHTNWSSATLQVGSTCNNGTRANPVVYWVGCEDNTFSYNPDSWNTMIRHGNWDFKTQGVAEWGGGSNHALQQSMYYTSKPAFFGACAWPPFGPENNPTINMLPAQARYKGTTCGPRPAAPSGLGAVVN